MLQKPHPSRMPVCGTTSASKNIDLYMQT
jgi:hypothetical protein